MSYDPKYAVREPDIDAITNLIGTILRSAGADTLKDVMSGFGEADAAERNQKASEGFVMLLLDALSQPTTRDDLLFILADLWVYEPANLDEPPEFFDYEPDPAKVKAGQAVPRDERWRALSRRNRKRLVKRYELGALPVSALIEFVNAFKETVDFAGFLGSVNSLSTASLGNSRTSSPADTAGTTE